MNARALALVPILAALFLAACGTPADSDTHTEADPHEHEEESAAGVVRLDPEAIRLAGIHTEPARAEELDEPLVVTAAVAPNSSRVVHVRPLSRGIVEQVLVAQGDRVRRGQVLLDYDNVELGELANQYRSRSTAVRPARSEAELREKLLRQAETLYQAEAISRMELDVRTAAFRKAEESLESLQAELALTREKLRRYRALERVENVPPGEGVLPVSRTELRAPFSGTVIEFDVAPGEVVSPQQVLLTIADLSSVWVLADIHQKDLQELELGQRVGVRSEAYPETLFPARLSSIGDLVDPGTRTVKVRCETPNPGHRLKLGMFVMAEIHTGRRQQRLALPEEAVLTLEDRPFVFVLLSPGIFQRRTVEVAFRRQGLVAVSGGLEAGEEVVTRGAFALKSQLRSEELGGGHAH